MLTTHKHTRVEAPEPQDVRISSKNVSALGHLVVKLIGAHQVDQVVPTHKHVLEVIQS